MDSRLRGNDKLLAVFRQHFSRQIQRPADQNPRRRFAARPARAQAVTCSMASSRSSAGAASRPARARRIIKRARAHAGRPRPGSPPSPHAAPGRERRAENPPRPCSSACRRSDRAAARPCSSRSAMARDTAAAPCGLWPPSSQISASSGASATSGHGCSRCSRAGHSTVRRPLSIAASSPQSWFGMAQRGDGDAGILDLMAADQFGQRQVEQTRLVFIDHAAMFLAADEILAEHRTPARPAGRPGAG